MIIPEKTAGLLVCQNDEEEEKFLVNWSGTSLCCCFYAVSYTHLTLPTKA